MRRLGTATVLVWILSVVLIASALHYGHVEAKFNELQELGFDVCSGQPCFRGLNGSTFFEKDFDLIASSLNSDPAGISRLSRIIEIQLDKIPAYVQFDQSGFDVVPYSTMPILTVGRFIDLYGKPCDLLVDKRGKTLTLLYPKLTLDARLNNGRLQLDSTVRQVRLSTPSQFQTQCMQVRQWIGFTTLLHYTERGVIRVFN